MVGMDFRRMVKHTETLTWPAKDITNEQTFMKFSGYIGHDTKNNWLILGPLRIDICQGPS